MGLYVPAQIIFCRTVEGAEKVVARGAAARWEVW